MLLLKAKIDKDPQHGNGIMYGGESKSYDIAAMLGGDKIHELFYVETDFGNHMKLSWNELNEMFYVVGVRDYQQWRTDRNYLLSQPSYLDQDKEHIDGINEAMFNLRSQM